MMGRVICWALAISLAALLLVVIYGQLLGPQPNPVFGLIAARSGISLFEPWGRYATAVLEIVAVGLLLWPRMRVPGAALSLIIAATAIGFHLSPWLGIAIPTPDAFHEAWVRNLPILADTASLQSDQGAMFMLAVVIALLSLANLWAERFIAHLPEKTRRQAGAYA